MWARLGGGTAGREPPGGPVGAILSDPARAFDLRDALKRVEHDLLQQALAAQRYNQRATARQLGLTYDQLRGRLRKHDLLGDGLLGDGTDDGTGRSEEHTSELQSLMRISYAVFCLKKKKPTRRTSLN